MEVFLEGRRDASASVAVTGEGLDPSATLVFADGTRLGPESARSDSSGRSEGSVDQGLVLTPLPAADLVAVELAWRAFDLHATLPLAPTALRDAVTRAVPRG